VKISTKGRYAVRMLLDLAAHQGGGCVSLGEIAERQNVSRKYLEQIVPLLSASGMLRTVRGPQGGYRLARAPEACTVGEILRLTEGTLSPVACLDTEVNLCARAADCPTLPVWEGLYRVVREYLDGITLADLLRDEETNKNDKKARE